MRTQTVASLSESRLYSDQARDVASQLDRRLDLVESAVRRSPAWTALCDPDTPTEEVRALLREVMWSVAVYQPHTTEAGFAMIGRLPKHERKLLVSLLHHKAEEAEHGGWARRDFILLGGDAAALQNVSPATFAVIAVWHRMAITDNPLGYLGAEYLFECLTMRLLPDVVRALRSAGVPGELTNFVNEHETEDIRHTNLILHLVLDVVSRYSDCGDAILQCFDRFAAVYPLPVWAEAYERSDPGRRTA